MSWESSLVLGVGFGSLAARGDSPPVQLQTLVNSLERRQFYCSRPELPLLGILFATGVAVNNAKEMFDGLGFFSCDFSC